MENENKNIEVAPVEQIKNDAPQGDNASQNSDQKNKKFDRNNRGNGKRSFGRGPRKDFHGVVMVICSNPKHKQRQG